MSVAVQRGCSEKTRVSISHDPISAVVDMSPREPQRLLCVVLFRLYSDALVSLVARLQQCFRNSETNGLRRHFHC